MPHITLDSGEPGIRGLLGYRPETGRPLSELAEVLLRGPGTLARGERELIAALFCMLNRYVDGPATVAPEDPAVYAAGAQRLISQGYLPPPAHAAQRTSRG
jgi:hypothetical protein